jgi:hypothetical protein
MATGRYRPSVGRLSKLRTQKPMAGTMFRNFASLEEFAAAKDELRKAFAENFIEWSQKKLVKAEVVAAK